MSDDTLIQFSSGPRVVTPEANRLTPLHAECTVCGQRFGAQATFCPFDGERLVPLSAPGARELSADPLIGVVVDERYRIEQVLGSGGMGTVYEATHIVLARRMALKVLRHELAGQGDLSARFLREARAAASIEHPNVVRISDFGTLPSGQAYFVMELLSGTSLRSLVTRGPLDPDRVASIARQVADGLAAAHRAGIVHRDLKPDNIQIDPLAGDYVKVLDFGLARVAGTSRLTKEGVVFGTPQYMSPEQAAGELVDHRSDIYGLGVMMYEMLTGRVPFEADTYMGVLTKHLRTPPVPPRVVLGERDLGGLEPIVLRALEKSPARRFSNMTELMMALDQRGAARVERRQVERRPVAGWGERPGSANGELISTELLQVAGLPKRLAWPDLGQVPRWLVPAALGAAFACVTMAWVLHERPGDPPLRGSEVTRVTTSTAELAPAALAPPSLAPAAPAEFSGGQPVATSQSAPQAVTPTAVAVAPAAEKPSDPGPEKPVQPAPAKVIRPTVTREATKIEAPKPAPTAPKRRSHVAGDIIDPWAETP